MARRRKPNDITQGQSSVDNSYTRLLRKQSREEFYDKLTPAPGCIGLSKHEAYVKRRQLSSWSRVGNGLTRLYQNKLLRVYLSPSGWRWIISQPTGSDASTTSFSSQESCLIDLERHLQATTTASQIKES
jgi:hypothetical protein